MNKHILKKYLLEKLYEPYKNCKACPLGNLGRKNIVFGPGNENGDILIIGEAPGKEEDDQGLPFVGRSGRLLNKALEVAKIDKQNIFITNIVKCRPPNNRTPLPNETSICTKLFLFNQIKILRPKIIITLGSIAINSLFETSFKITKIRGQKLEYNDFVVIPTYHPAYILRNPKELVNFVADLQKATELLNNTI